MRCTARSRRSKWASSAAVPRWAAANTAGPAGYRRLLVETSAAVRNLDSRTPFMPPYSAKGGADGLNVGGG